VQNRLRIVIVLGVATGLLGFGGPSNSQQPQKKTPPKLPEGTAIERDLSYGPHKERNVLDLYVPKGDGPFPLIVWVHGGAWQAGSKESGGQALRFVSQGYAVASINYRLSQHAVYPAQIHDCKAAIRFLRANAKKYRLDGDHIGVWGSSAGGHLVALLGTTGDVKDLEGDGGHRDVSSRVQAVCDWFGPTDLTRMAKQTVGKAAIDHDAANSPESRLIGGAIQENTEKAKKANPLEYVSKDDPPFLIFHGDKDSLVPIGQSEILHEALKKAGVDSTFVRVAGAGHGNGIGTPAHMTQIVEFFDKTLKGKK
jgi:acetyl esterase/lipase